jgi:hypothetical protein
MVIGGADESQGLVVLLLCLVAVALAVNGLVHRPRCRRCHLPAEVDEAAGSDLSPPVVMLIYRCPRCLGVVHRRFLGAWD